MNVPVVIIRYHTLTAINTATDGGDYINTKFCINVPLSCLHHWMTQSISNSTIWASMCKSAKLYSPCNNSNAT